jgi:hypothetical protein
MKPKSKPSELRTVLHVSRNQAINLATRVGQEKLRIILLNSQKELIHRLHQAEGLSGPGPNSFTAVQMRATLAQLQHLLATTTNKMGKLILDQADKASESATKHLLDYMHEAERTFKGVNAPLQLKEARLFDRVSEGVHSTVLRRLASSGEGEEGAEEFHPAKDGVLQRYGKETIGHFESELQQSVLTKRPWADVRESLIAKSSFLQGAPAHWAERIVRTEMMGAMNRGNWEATRQANNELGDVVKVLSATFDDRTGWDSFQVHGQIRRTAEAFQWKEGMYQHPPNRPNDREVVLPHRISWPIPPSLKWRSDGEVMARYRMQRKSGSPGPRPPMTTIPLERFGKG